MAKEAGRGVPAAAEEFGPERMGAPARRMNSVVVQAEDRFAEIPQLDVEDGLAFGWFDRLNLGWRDGAVFTYDDWQARDLAEMMRRDYKARQVEAVLTYPTLAAERTWEGASGDKGELELLQAIFSADPLDGGCADPLDTIIDQNAGAVVYKKSFHEIVWDVGASGPLQGHIVPKRIAYRPPTVTRLLREPRHGRVIGFEQDPWNIGTTNMLRRDTLDGRIVVPLSRAYIHIHGARRDPINGLSDLEVPYWAYKTKQKVLLLWFQFLEGVALPRVIVKADDPALANKIARGVANAKNSGVTPIGTDGRPDSVSIEPLDLSGKGSEQFLEAVRWLDACATNSVLAGFLDLAQAAVNGRGSHALSSDASDFFLMTLESKNREIESSLRNNLFAPIVRHNYGPRGRVPRLKFASLTSEDRGTAVNMMTTVLGSYAQQPELIPDDFVQPLAAKVADFMGIDGAKVSAAFAGQAKRAADLAAKKSAAAASPAGQTVAAAAGATAAAQRAVAAGRAGKDPLKAAKRSA